MTDAEYRTAKLTDGLRFQDHVVTVLLRERGLAVPVFSSREFQIARGESACGIEIKFDDKYARTGNLWIELGEKAMPRDGAYAPSGILRDDNTWLYVIGNYSILFAFAKVDLLRAYATGRYPVVQNDRRTSQGFLLPHAHAVRLAAFVEPDPATDLGLDDAQSPDSVLQRAGVSDARDAGGSLRDAHDDL